MSHQDLVKYWRDRHANGRPPSRADLDPPFEIPKLLSNLMLVDVLPEGFRMRLIGSEIIKRIGHDNTGKILGSEINADPQIGRMITFLNECVKSAGPIYFSSNKSNVSPIRVNGVLLPLVDAEGHITHILGGIFYEADQLVDIGLPANPNFLLVEPPPEKK